MRKVHTVSGSHNWLVATIVDEHLLAAFKLYARGVLVDIGCGTKPYADTLKAYVTRHIGVDHPDTLHDTGNIEIFANAYNTGLGSDTADTVLATAVLEHLERPQEAVNEMARILTPGGHVILTAPFFWHLHEAPRDFYRYTKFGLEHLIRDAGLEPVEIRRLAGYFVTAAQELCYYVEWRRRGALKWPVGWVQNALQGVAYWMYTKGRDRGADFCWMHLAVGKKPGQPRGQS
jgi:SAM-dependent methyltransferase